MAEITDMISNISDRLQRVDEALAAAPTDLTIIKRSVAKIETDISIMRAVVTDHSYELKAYGERLRDLEISY